MTHLDYLNTNFSIRRTDKEKSAFREFVIQYCDKKGIKAHIEKTKDGKNENIIVGDPLIAKAVFTAHYDTPARALFPNIMMPKNKGVHFAYQFVPVIFLLAISFLFAILLGNVIFDDERVYFLTFLATYYLLFYFMFFGSKNSKNYNDNTSGVATLLTIMDNLSSEELEDVAFIFFDNEEKGKKGSAAYFKDHSNEMSNRFLLNFDCVGNGNNIIFISEKGAVNKEELKTLETSFCSDNAYDVEFCTYKQGSSNSDHKNFPCGVACVACRKNKSGFLYTPYIHTPKDVVSNNSNIDFITKNTVDFVRKLK